MSEPSYGRFIEEEARLTILRELAQQPGHRLNEILLTRVLEAVGHTRSRDWVRTQIRKLAELGGVTVTEISTVLVAELTRAGLEHVQKRSVIEGVAKPAPGE